MKRQRDDSPAEDQGSAAPGCVQTMPELEGYHAHIYAMSAEADPGLLEIHDRAGRELERVRVGRLHREPVGPHLRPMFQLAFSRTDIAYMLPWLIEHRGSHSVLVHPLLGDALLEHTDAALWLGPPLDLDLAVFGGEVGERIKLSTTNSRASISNGFSPR